MGPWGRRFESYLSDQFIWAWRSLEARVVWIHQVAGSNPAVQTKIFERNCVRMSLKDTVGSLFAQKQEESYATIVAPLKDIEIKLQDHVENMKNKKQDLEVEKAEIDKEIKRCDGEQTRSENTMLKIGELLY